MNALMAECIGTFILIVMGNGVNANVSLKKTYGHGSGWLVIAFGWAIAVFAGVFVSAPYSGAHLNPAVSVGLAFAGKFAWADVPGYVGAQFAGAILGAMVNWLAYKKHFDSTEDGDATLGVFCNAPAIPSVGYNLVTEAAGTFVLVFGVLMMVKPGSSLGALDALPVALLVLGIGLSLGGATGYAINPARDMGPRIAHFLLPIPHKRDSNWGYSWIPVIGPLLGALLAGAVYKLLV